MLRWPSALVEPIVDTSGSAARHELILDILRNTANKIAVAFGADASQVETGVEYLAINGMTSARVTSPAGRARYLNNRSTTPGSRLPSHPRFVGGS